MAILISFNTGKSPEKLFNPIKGWLASARSYITSAAICPHCGILFDEKVLGIIKSNEKKLKKKNKKFSLKKFILDMFLILLFMILIFLVGNMLINKSAENYNNVNGTNVVSEK